MNLPNFETMNFDWRWEERLDANFLPAAIHSKLGTTHNGYLPVPQKFNVNTEDNKLKTTHCRDGGSDRWKKATCTYSSIPLICFLDPPRSNWRRVAKRSHLIQEIKHLWIPISQWVKNMFPTLWLCLSYLPQEGQTFSGSKDSKGLIS